MLTDRVGIRAAIVGVTLLLLLLADASVLANGGKGKRIVYRGSVPAGDDPGLEFEAELEPLLFRLATVGDKYRVVRIRIRNTGLRSLALSATGDRMEVRFRSGPLLDGILDLGARDPTLWDRLSPQLRTAIAYPQVVDRGEEESIFVFVLATDAVEAPSGFRYRIASLPGGPVTIRDVTPVKKK